VVVIKEINMWQVYEDVWELDHKGMHLHKSYVNAKKKLRKLVEEYMVLDSTGYNHEEYVEFTNHRAAILTNIDNLKEGEFMYIEVNEEIHLSLTLVEVSE